MFLDRGLATLVHLRHGVTHDVLGCWFGMSRSTITRAVGEVRPLLGRARLHRRRRDPARKLADVVAHLGANGRLGLLVPPRCGSAARRRGGRVGIGWSRVRRGRTPPRALVITHAEGRLLFCGQTGLSALHDLTQVRQAGLVELLALTRGVSPFSLTPASRA